MLSKGYAMLWGSFNLQYFCIAFHPAALCVTTQQFPDLSRRQIEVSTEKLATQQVSSKEHIPIHITTDSEYTSDVYSDAVIVSSLVTVNSTPLNSNNSTFMVKTVSTVIKKEKEKEICPILFSDRTEQKCLDK